MRTARSDSVLYIAPGTRRSCAAPTGEGAVDSHRNLLARRHDPCGAVALRRLDRRGELRGECEGAEIAVEGGSVEKSDSEALPCTYHAVRCRDEVVRDVL